MPRAHACARRKMSMYPACMEPGGVVSMSKPHVCVPHSMVDGCVTHFDDRRYLRYATAIDVRMRKGGAYPEAPPHIPLFTMK